jgi:hypothetical protein
MHVLCVLEIDNQFRGIHYFSTENLEYSLKVVERSPYLRCVGVYDTVKEIRQHIDEILDHRSLEEAQTDNTLENVELLSNEEGHCRHGIPEDQCEKCASWAPRSYHQRWVD